jgi:hypothetical protein
LPTRRARVPAPERRAHKRLRPAGRPVKTPRRLGLLIRKLASRQCRTCVNTKDRVRDRAPVRSPRKIVSVDAGQKPQDRPIACSSLRIAGGVTLAGFRSAPAAPRVSLTADQTAGPAASFRIVAAGRRRLMRRTSVLRKRLFEQSLRSELGPPVIKNFDREIAYTSNTQKRTRNVS